MSVHAEATAVLHTASPGIDRTMLAWAVGAFRVRHCLHFAQYRTSRNPAMLDSHCAGGASREFDYWITTRGFTGQVRATGHQFTTGWREVAAILDGAVDDPALVDEQTRLLHQRVALTEQYDELFARRQRGDLDEATDAEQDELGDQWSYLERRCADAAARTWEQCHPRTRAEQLDLFA